MSKTPTKPKLKVIKGENKIEKEIFDILLKPKTISKKDNKKLGRLFSKIEKKSNLKII